MAIKTQEFVRLSEEDEDEETVKQVQITSTSSNEIKLGIEIILQKIEAAFILLQQYIEHLHLQLDPNIIPQINGNADLVLDLVIFCDFCNEEFIEGHRGTHYINEDLAPYGWKASTNQDLYKEKPFGSACQHKHQ